ncbi:MAG: DUF5674 family protein [Candidatus Latescibacterota bacterium]|jgi:hypothetical protein
MKILQNTIAVGELKSIAESTFGDLVKAVVDVRIGVVALDAELHSDLEALLIDLGSRQEDLWGINFYPDLSGDDFIEFDSMINVRPSQGNATRGVDDPAIRSKIIEVVDKWVTK